MSQIETILDLDQQDFGSFRSLEKNVGYTTLLLATVPLLFSPFLFTLLKRNIYRLTLALIGFSFLLFLTLRFRFSWIVWLDYHLQQYARI